VLVGRNGAVVSPRANQRARIVQLVLAAGVGAIAVAANPIVGAAVVAGGLAGVGASRRWVLTVNRAIRLASADDPDDAERVLDALGEPIMNRAPRRAHVALARALIAERRGDLATAVAHADECSARMPTPRRGYYIVYWQNLFNRCGWLCELGRVDDARAALARCGRAPGGEWYVSHYRGVALRAALIGATDVPADDVLYAWLRDALRYNHTGVTIAVIGHFLEQRGDAESAVHAYEQAGVRFLDAKTPERIARIYPTLWALIGPKIEAARAKAEAE
jgi:hypothetical protein